MLQLLTTNATFRIGLLVALFVVVVGISMIVMTVISRRSALRKELHSIATSETISGAAVDLRREREDLWTHLADRIEKAGLNLTDTKSDVLRERMIAAGYASPGAPRIYTLIRLLLVIFFPLAVVGLSLFAGTQFSLFSLYATGCVAALFGLYVPALFVRAKADRRREAIVNGFPDSLDLMLVCVEAGLGLEAALHRVGKEMAISHPLISELLTTATLQLRAGASREVALRKMADAARVDEIGSFATLLIQSDKLGTSIATTLRIYASEMRERRRMRAEEKAHRIPVLISIPLVTCMLPVMIGVLMLPAAILIVRRVFPSMGGG